MQVQCHKKAQSSTIYSNKAVMHLMKSTMVEGLESARGIAYRIIASPNT